MFTCGEVATTNVTLTADESCPGNTAIFVGAKGITINLNGHTLSGDGTHDGVADSNFDNAIVENGVISNFAYGVLLIANSSRATNLRVEDNVNAGIFAIGSKDLVSGNYADLNNWGIVEESGEGDQVTGNWLESNTGYGIVLEYVTGAVVTTNKVLNTTGSGDGVVIAASTGQVTGNVANGNVADGIYVSNDTTTVKPGLTLSKNRAAFNGADGIDSAAGSSVDGGGNIVQDNASAAQCANVVCDEVAN